MANENGEGGEFKRHTEVHNTMHAHEETGEQTPTSRTLWSHTCLSGGVRVWTR